jgi:hypothetical protein
MSLILMTVAALGCGKVTPDAPDSGGGTTATNDAATGPSTAQACADLAMAECEKRVSCTNKVNPAGAGLVRVFGTMDACLAREALQCMSTLAAPDSGHNTTKVEQCVAAYATYSCDDFYDDNPPDICRPAGTRANGAACDYGAQCKSGYCGNAKNTLCGMCADTPAVGASCVTSDCGRDQMCDGTTTTCVAPGKAGDACDAEICGYALTCPAAGTLTSTRTCATTTDTAGAACGAIAMMLPQCDGIQGLSCEGAVGSKTCVAQAFVADGMPCGALTSGFATCIAGSCYTDKGLIGAGETGTCKADAADDASCDIVAGPACQLPARCVVKGGNSGKCTIPTGSCG